MLEGLRLASRWRMFSSKTKTFFELVEVLFHGMRPFLHVESCSLLGDMTSPALAIPNIFRPFLEGLSVVVLFISVFKNAILQKVWNSSSKAISKQSDAVFFDCSNNFNITKHYINCHCLFLWTWVAYMHVSCLKSLDPASSFCFFSRRSPFSRHLSFSFNSVVDARSTSSSAGVLSQGRRFLSLRRSSSFACSCLHDA